MSNLEGGGLTAEQRLAMWRKFPALLAEIDAIALAGLNLPTFIAVVTGDHPSLETIASIERKLNALGLTGGMTVHVEDKHREQFERQFLDMQGIHSAVLLYAQHGEDVPLKPRPVSPFWSADYRNKRGRR